MTVDPYISEPDPRDEALSWWERKQLISPHNALALWATGVESLIYRIERVEFRTVAWWARRNGFPAAALSWAGPRIAEIAEQQGIPTDYSEDGRARTYPPDFLELVGPGVFNSPPPGTPLRAA